MKKDKQVIKNMWAISNVSENQLDGRTQYFKSFESDKQFDASPTIRVWGVALFDTRAEAREYIRNEVNFIRKRKDLRAEPHGWKVPKVVKVKVTIQEV